MSDLPFLPLYIDDYEAATAHLSMLEDGAYNRLLRLCWRTPGCKLPDDEAWILRKLRATTEAEIAAVRVVLAEFFMRGRGRIWSKRLLEHFLTNSVIRQKKSQGGKTSQSRKAMKSKEKKSKILAAENQESFNNQNQNQNHKEDGGGGNARDPEFLQAVWQGQTFRERLLGAMAADPISGLTGPGGRVIGTQVDMAQAARWLAMPGMSEDAILAEVARIMAAKPDGPPSRFSYFDGPMQRLSAALSAPPMDPIRAAGQPIRGSPEKPNVDEIMRKLEAEGRA